jgi:CBS domain-containing protein
MIISEVLDAKAYTVCKSLETELLETAVACLAEKRIGAVVVDSLWQQLIGIFSERDLVRALAELGLSALTKPRKIVAMVTRTWANIRAHENRCSRFGPFDTD